MSRVHRYDDLAGSDTWLGWGTWWGSSSPATMDTKDTALPIIASPSASNTGIRAVSAR